GPGHGNALRDPGRGGGHPISDRRPEFHRLFGGSAIGHYPIDPLFGSTHRQGLCWGPDLGGLSYSYGVLGVSDAVIAIFFIRLPAANYKYTFKVSRFDIRGKRLFQGGKYYFENTGIRNASVGYRPGDRGQLVENLIFCQLR